MGITLSSRPDYVVNETIAGVGKAFPKIYYADFNSASFQIEWDAGLTAGEFVVYGSNEEYPTKEFPTYAPINTKALTPIPLASIDVAIAPYDTLDAGMIETTSACSVVWVEYVGSGTGTVSIAFHGKTLG